MSFKSVLAGFTAQASALGLSEEAYFQEVVLTAMATGTTTDLDAILAAATGGDVANIQAIKDAVTFVRTASLKATKSTAIATADVSAVVTADAAVQSGSYVQADVQTIAALANSTKAALNLTITLLNAVKAKVNTMNA